MSTLKTDGYVEELERITKPFEFRLEGIQVVPSIAQWWRDHGMPGDLAYSIAKVVRNRKTGKYLILLASEISEESIDQIKSRIAAYELAEETAHLKSEKDLLMHIILHELYHAVNDMLGRQASNKECDLWAFRQLGISTPE